LTEKAKSTPAPYQIGRIRAAWLVLTGQQIVPQQMQAEWTMIMGEAADMFNKFSSLAARLVKAEKRQMRAALKDIDDCEGCEEGQPPAVMASGGRKALLRSKAAGRRAIRMSRYGHKPRGNHEPVNASEQV